jgi:hypothetical protein
MAYYVQLLLLDCECNCVLIAVIVTNKHGRELHELCQIPVSPANVAK